MKCWQSINFTTCTKDQRVAQKFNLQNYHIWLTIPVQRSRDLHSMSEVLGQLNAEAIPLTCPRNFYAPMCHIQIVKLPGVLCSTELGIAICTRCQPKAKIIRNHWQRLEMIGIGHVTSVVCGTIMWSSANGAKIQKYMNSKLWSSSPITWRRHMSQTSLDLFQLIPMLSDHFWQRLCSADLSSI